MATMDCTSDTLLFGKEQENTIHPAVMAVAVDWQLSIPKQLPEYIDLSESPPFKNSAIGNYPEETYRSIYDDLAFLIEVALSEPGNELFGLGKQATYGYINYLESLQGALSFEMNYRSNDGIPKESD